MSGNLFIILPTYNGAKYLTRQIASIQAQTLSNWHLLLRDDGSTDETLEILRKFSSDDNRIVLLENTQGNLGPAGSFSWLIERALELGADYVAFSDQDDIWFPNKLAITLSRMLQIEKQRGNNTPVLVHTDLEIVTKSLKMISPSFMQYENIGKADEVSISTLLVQNHVVGCTMLSNRALLDKATPVPSSARMHDWWLAASAVVTGVLSYIPEPTISYRQHDDNTLGVAGFGLIFNPFSKAWHNRLKKRPELQRKTTLMAESLSARFCDTGKSMQLALLIRCNMCLHRHWGVSRVFCSYQAKMKGQNWAATLTFYLLLLLAVWR